MNKFGKLLLITFTLFLVSGCVVVSGPPFTEADEPEENKALVYVYRVKKFAGGEIVGDVFINQQFVGETKNGAYIYGYLPEGGYKIALDSGSFNKVYDLKGGQTYYFEVVHVYSESYPSYSHSLTIKRRDSQEGSAKIVGTKLIGTIEN